MGGFFEVEGGEDAIVDFGEMGDAGDGLCGVIDADLVMLNALQLRQSAFRRQVAVGGAEALAYDAMKDQGDEANTGVRANSVRQAMEDRATRVRQLRSQVSDLLSSEFKTLPYKRFNC